MPKIRLRSRPRRRFHRPQATLELAAGRHFRLAIGRERNITAYEPWTSRVAGRPIAAALGSTKRRRGLHFTRIFALINNQVVGAAPSALFLGSAPNSGLTGEVGPRASWDRARPARNMRINSTESDFCHKPCECRSRKSSFAAGFCGRDARGPRGRVDKP